MKPFTKSLILAAGWLLPSAFAEVLGGPIFNAATGHAYYILTPNTWTNSEDEAMRLGGHLVTINDASEQEWVYSTFSRYGGDWKNLWIGLTDASSEGNFRWVSGEPVKYTNWYPGEPNNSGGNENYAELTYNRSGQWNDAPNSWVTGVLDNGVVEVMPFPSAKEIWDANAGLIITSNSPLHDGGGSFPFDARDIFGGNFGKAPYAGQAIFADNATPGFVYSIQWKTPSPVTVKSIRLYTGTDGTGREFSTFTLKAKPPGSDSFSTILYYYYNPPHPYVLLPNGALTEANVVPTTAQEFRAEFLNYTAQTAKGPRIVELDGFDQYLAINFVPVTARLAVQLKFPGYGTNDYQVQWSSVLNPDTWFDLGPPFRGGDSFTDPITNDKRFYRVLQLE